MTNPPRNNIIRFPRENAAEIDRAAAAWATRIYSRLPTTGDIAELALWRAASPEHDRVYREMERIWAAAGARRSAYPRDDHRFAVLTRHRGWFSVRNGLIAASVMLGIGGAATAQDYAATWRYDYHTAPGEIRTLALADGSRVTMKGDTALDVHVAATGTRTIDLARGEAFFEVTHDAARPFLVDAGSAVIRDLGTGFSIERTGQSGTVSVDHGVVEVSAAGQSDILRKGQQVRFGLYDLGSKARIDPGAIAAWRHGLYIAEDKPLSEVLGRLDEYRAGRIIVTSAALSGRRINAVVQLNHIDAWLDALGKTDGVSVRRWGSFVIVSDDTR